ncbi:CBY1-interacting BAR domain-containing protein 1 isoform X1 [Hetaerina americana]|uniref:CBY1-interacting BAR domain-containing protein 1 isoform X1 n=1 Tax=Hetaerina americana TaxID=62018 RepID=UPI003A7F3636
MQKAERTMRIPNELQARFVLERVLSVEKNFSELCSGFAAYTRKCARLRDKGDDLAKFILSFAESEILNKSMRSGLMRFSNSVSAVGDLRDTLVHRIEKKVITELSSYGNACQLAKEDVKSAITSAEREQQRKGQFERIRARNPRNRQQISKAESEYQRANSDAVRTSRILEERAIAFEERKLLDVKELFLHFAKAEVAYHSKALEMFTQAYQEIAKLEINDDLEEFRSALKTPGDSYPSRLEVVKRTSLRVNPSTSAPSLLSLTGLFGSSLSSSRKSSEQSQNPSSVPSTPHSSARSIFKRGSSEDSLRKSSTRSAESVQIEDYKEDEQEDEDDDDDIDEDDDGDSQSEESEQVVSRQVRFR